MLQHGHEHDGRVRSHDLRRREEALNDMDTIPASAILTLWARLNADCCIKHLAHPTQQIAVAAPDFQHALAFNASVIESA